MNLVKKVLLAELLFFVFCFAFTPKIYAASWDEIKTQADSFVAHGSENNVSFGKDVGKSINSVAQILTTIGLAIIMVGLLIIGIRYMMASPEEAAKLKGQLVGLVVSGIVIFGAYSIWALVVNFFAATV